MQKYTDFSLKRSKRKVSSKTIGIELQCGHTVIIGEMLNLDKDSLSKHD